MKISGVRWSVGPPTGGGRPGRGARGHFRGECALCKGSRGKLLPVTKMPGNSMGIYGGFSSHIAVPARFLCPVGDLVCRWNTWP